MCSSFIPAHTAGANSCIHLCRRTVSESDWDLQTFKMITFLFCLFISRSASLCLLLVTGIVLPSTFNPSLSVSFSSFSFLHSSPPPPLLFLPSSVFLSLYPSDSPPPFLCPETDSAVERRQQRRWSANLLSFPLSIAMCECVCGTVLDTGQESHPLSCHSL